MKQIIFYTQKHRSWFLISFTIFLVFLALWRMVHFADWQGYFIDEAMDSTGAAWNFFRHLNYTSLIRTRPFEPMVTSGLAATWISGITWSAGLSIFTTRLFLAAYIYMQFHFLVFSFLRRYQITKELALCITCFLWLFYLREIPYAFGFEQNLGETQAGLCLLWAVYFMQKRPILAFLFLGISVWNCKLLFLPAAAALGFSYWLCEEACFSKKGILRGFFYTFVFFIPLILWMLLIALRFDFHTLKEWLNNYYYYVLNDGPSGLKNVQKMKLLDSLSYRLSIMEWPSYTNPLRARIILFMLSPAMAIATHSICSLWIPTLRSRWDRQEKIFAIIVSGIVCFYAYWWFFISPVMFLRHAQVAFFLSFGFWCYFLFRIYIRNQISNSPKYKLMNIGLGIIVIAFLLIEIKIIFTRETPLLMPTESYARRCKEKLYTPICAPGTVFYEK